MSRLSDQAEIGVQCTCGFKRRATKISDNYTCWNGREIESLHWFEIKKGAAVSHPFTKFEPGAEHTMSMGLLATMDWPAVTEEEQRIGEAWAAGRSDGWDAAHEHMRVRLAHVTSQAFS